MTQNISDVELVTTSSEIERAVLEDVMAVIPEAMAQRYRLTDKKLLALGFAAKPRAAEGRFIKPTAKEIAAFAGVAVNTIYRWRGEPWWNKALREIAVQSMGERIPGALESLATLAEMGDSKALKLFFEMTGLAGGAGLPGGGPADTASMENYLAKAEDESGEVPLGDYYEY